jgi:hypothetical protein
VRHGLEVTEVVGGDDLDVGAGRLHGAEEVAADPAESVDAHAYSHGKVSSSEVKVATSRERRHDDPIACPRAVEPLVRRTYE